MISLGQKLEVLRKYFIENIPKKQISRELDISKNTVKSYIKEFEESQKELINSGVSKYDLIEKMVNKPKYTSINRKPRVITSEVTEIIEKHLEENEIKRNTGKRKMCMSAQDIYEDLIERGYQLSYSSVAHSVAKIEVDRHTNEAYIKQNYDYGDICEFDWGDVKLKINNQEIKYRMAVFTMAKSNYRFAYLYPNENTQSYIDAHIRFFETIGGVPRCMVYDNMKVAVAKFIGRTEKEATEALKKLSIYYGFKYRFCNIRSGNEKGHVENSVDFVRRKAFASLGIFNTEEEAFKRLQERLDKYNKIKTKYLENQSAEEILKIEQEYLLKLMPTYLNCIDETLRVDKLSTISYLQNRYSVPDYLVSKAVDVRVFIDKIEIFYKGKLVSEHKRLYGKQEWSLKIEHYLKTLQKKPGALKGSVAFSQMNSKLKELYIKYFEQEAKGFIELLELIGNTDIHSITETIDILTQKNIKVNIENIKMIVNRKNNITEKRSETNMQKEIEENAKRHLAMYDQIIGTKGIEGGIAV